MDVGCLLIVAVVGAIGAFNMLRLLSATEVGWLQLLLPVLGTVVPFGLFTLQGWIIVRVVLQLAVPKLTVAARDDEIPPV